jgi:type IX secretion system PorP/SprF family membrane protein
MKNRFIISIFLLLGLLKAQAQQDAMYTQYMFNTLAINPAYAGSRNVLSATGLMRTQWIGIEGAPQTQTVSLDAAMPKKRVGLGVQIFNDKIGVTRTSGASISYAYRIPTQRGTLALGLQGSITHYKADFVNIRLNSGSPVDAAFAYDINKIMPNVGTGIYYNTDRLYVGASLPHLLNNRLANGNDIVGNNTLAARQYLHLFVMAGYVLPVGYDFKLKPSVLFKGVKGSPMQLDLNCNFWIKDAIGIGAQYRTKDAVAGILEIQASEQIRLGYSYDYTTSSLTDYNSGSHEIMIRYEFGYNKSRIVAPRYF